jgi:murein L,D-transpeptidase YafK
MPKRSVRVAIFAAFAVTALLFITQGYFSSEGPLPLGARADQIVIEKAARRLTLYSGGRALKSYHVALGRNPKGLKLRQGDNRTPEGIYSVDGHNPNSRYHRSLHVSYPNAHDRSRAKAAGVSPGGDIMIHGIQNGLGWLGRFHRVIDWTRGCIAVTNEEIEEISRVVPDGATVEIRP